MIENIQLPAEFAALQPYMAEWCLSNERDRFEKLVKTSIPELKSFFDAMLPLSEAIARRLNDLDQHALGPVDRSLFYLLMTFIETAHPIELKWDKTDIEDSFAPERMIFGPSSCVSPI